jgi:hypothetical protein
VPTRAQPCRRARSLCARSDLLDFTPQQTPRRTAAPTIVIRDLPRKGVFLEGSSTLRTPVDSAEHALELLRRSVPLVCAGQRRSCLAQAACLVAARSVVHPLPDVSLMCVV